MVLATSSTSLVAARSRWAICPQFANLCQVLFHPLMLEDEPARRLAAWAAAFAADSEDYMDETFLNSIAPPPTRHMLKHLQKAQKAEGGASDEDEVAGGSTDEEDGDEDVDADGSDAEATAPSQASQSGTPRLSPKSAAKAGQGPVTTVRLVLGNGDGLAAAPQAPKPRPVAAAAVAKGAGATSVPTPAPTPTTSGSGPTPSATPAPVVVPAPFPTPTPVPVGIPLGPAGPVAKPAASTGPLPGKHTVPTGPLSTSTFVFPTRRPPPVVAGLDEAILNSIQSLGTSSVLVGHKRTIGDAKVAALVYSLKYGRVGQTTSASVAC